MRLLTSWTRWHCNADLPSIMPLVASPRGPVVTFCQAVPCTGDASNLATPRLPDSAQGGNCLPRLELDDKAREIAMNASPDIEPPAPLRPSRLTRMPMVMCTTGLCRSTIHRMIAKNQFPAPFSLGERAVAWFQVYIDAWINARHATHRRRHHSWG